MTNDERYPILPDPHLAAFVSAPPELNPYVVVMSVLLGILTLVGSTSWGTFNETKDKVTVLTTKADVTEKRLDQIERSLFLIQQNQVDAVRTSAEIQATLRLAPWAGR